MQMYGLFASVLANFTDEGDTPRSCSISLGSRLPTRDPASDATTTASSTKKRTKSVRIISSRWLRGFSFDVRSISRERIKEEEVGR